MLNFSLGALGFAESIVIILVGIVLLAVGVLLDRKLNQTAGYSVGFLGATGIIFGVVVLIPALITFLF